VNEFEDRCAGVMLGLACGDALGAPAEGLSFEQAGDLFYGGLSDFLPHGRNGKWPAGSYTDDGEMALGLADSLVRRRGVDPADVGRTHAALCLTPPCRGYGPNTREKLQAIGRGSDPRTTGTGADSNGAVMRIAPLALAFFHCNGYELPVRQALLCTHTHPDAVTSAVALCEAVRGLVKAAPGMDDGGRFLESIKGFAGPRLGENVDWISGKVKAGGRAADEEVLDALVTPGSPLGRHFAIRAADCLAVALWCFLARPLDPEGAVCHAAGLGGDADTTAALTGVLGGALHGTGWLPRRWLDRLEDADKFRGAGLALAKLADEVKT
jgi:ADP-ribosylglycohydrolase